MQKYQTYIILLVFSIITNLFALDQWQCTCEQLMTEYDCMTQYQNRLKSGDIDTSQICFWYQEKCQNLMNYISDISCSSLNSDECSTQSDNIFSNNPTCIWYSKTSSASCSKFTRCQDYSYDTISQAQIQCSLIGCSRIGTQCSFDFRGRQQQKCSEIGLQTVCDSTFLKDSYSICTWNNSTSKCGTITINQCSDITIQDQCNLASTYCKWKGGSCQERNCADKEIQYLSGTNMCISFYSLEQQKYIQCVQDSNDDCVNQDSSQLNQQQCNFYSRYTYLWNTTTNSCYPCLQLNFIMIIKSFIIIMFILI